ncbi:MAG: transposase [gamma proteobacterium endosymbiont of Lamellibrachia anaximandri]|nr:transposase [gamma proteobacterium endosymbiont of Lamellibrachia anaximandri]
MEISEAVFILLLWKWLNMSSIAMFSKKALGTFSRARKDVMYDLLKREEINWRTLNSHTAKAVYQQNNLGGSRVKAFVLDDSIKTRCGKKMEGVSSHFDHVTGRHVMGQQVLTLGLATEEAFLPLDSQIYISQVKARELIKPHKDGRSVAGKRYSEATTQTKPEMAANMMKRALRSGIEADYVLADAWFGTKPMIRTALELDVCAILRMKKSKMKYRAVVSGRKKQLLNAQELYSYAVRQEWKKVRGMPWKAVTLDVELDLAEKDEKKPRWKRVRLLFVRGLQEPGGEEVGKKDWALFLTTDIQLSMSKMLETYALRWGIEVYFKEAKQHLGFLKEQTATFASHTASIHLCAIRYLMLVHNKLEGQDYRIGDIRSQMQDQLDSLSFAGRLWQIFRAIISGTLNELRKSLGCSVSTVMLAIDKRVHEFFIQSLQLDTFTMQLEYE